MKTRSAGRKLCTESVAYQRTRQARVAAGSRGRTTGLRLGRAGKRRVGTMPFAWSSLAFWPWYPACRHRRRPSVPNEQLQTSQNVSSTRRGWMTSGTRRSRRCCLRRSRPNGRMRLTIAPRLSTDREGVQGNAVRRRRVAGRLCHEMRSGIDSKWPYRCSVKDGSHSPERTFWVLCTSDSLFC